MHTTPARRVMIAMTMATMGRLMKNFGMALLSRGSGGRVRRHRVHQESLRNLLGALHHYTVLGLETGLDHHLASGLGPGADGTDADAVARAHHGHLGVSLDLPD